MKNLLNHIILSILSVLCICLNSYGQSSDSMRHDSVVVAGIEDNMVKVEGGTYIMGCTGPIWHGNEHHDCTGDQLPTHQVTVAGFKLCKYVVTMAEWKSVTGSYPKDYDGCDYCPVDDVSYDDAMAFIDKLKQLTGRHYRLPTEEEWEFAARGGNLSRHYIFPGSNNPDSVAWYDPTKYHRIKSMTTTLSGSSNFTWRNRNPGKTSPVGLKAPNELGLYDMAGNVPQLCSSLYRFYYGSTPSFFEDDYVARGCSYNGKNWDCSVSHRNYRLRDESGDILGFRLAED